MPTNELIAHNHWLQTELAALKALVREMSRAAYDLVSMPYFKLGWVKRLQKLDDILSRPEVRAIVEEE
jgi:hypothetical protein